MPYSKWKPDARLAPFVESFWIQESPADPEPAAPTRILPVGRVDLVVQFGDPFVRVDDGAESRLPAVHLTGQRTRSMAVRATGRTGILIVNFHPWGAAAFFRGLEAHVDESPDLGNFVARGRVDDLASAVRSASNIAERALAVEQFLLERFPSSPPDPLAVEAAERLRRSSGAESIESVASSLGLSRRHFGRVFRRAIGLSPKVFARVVRFQKTVCLRRLGAEWCQAALACGYADQAHLGHEVARLAGITPTELERRACARRLSTYFNTREPARFYNTIYL